MARPGRKYRHFLSSFLAKHLPLFGLDYSVLRENDYLPGNRGKPESNFLEVFKPAPVHFCTDFTSTASATVSTYGRVVLRLGTFLQAVKVVQDSHLLNTHPHPQPTRATLPSRHSFAGKYTFWLVDKIR
ncbi:hypothetical protein RF11_03131 [Thelohanellus kitauei]|uniref:Uncharacterized protein n=1 Tax=Thelohanellus kitauei TaxID=669202 RepID=A0A0C2JB19_THEKT|nr:hypothetical protein RF11_03131 [Thelohanellus kitauei]